MSTIKVSAEIKREIDRYRRFMLEHEYTTQTALGYSTYLSRFLRWPSRQLNNEVLNESIEAFLEYQRCVNPENHKECRAALRVYHRMATGENFPGRASTMHDPDDEAVAGRFYDYSVNIKRVNSKTAERDVKTVLRFLASAAGNPARHPESMTAHDIRDYVINHLAHLSDQSKGREITAIRNFFRFLKFEGVPVHESIFSLPLSPAVWKNTAFPVTMDMDVFDRLHEVPDASTPTGRRDRCIILFFTELALRCMEVSTLTLDDFNWREGHVTIRNTKSKSDRRLPMSGKLAMATVAYLRDARPGIDERTLFVRFRHCCGEPMGCGQIRGVVRRVYEKSGADIRSTGPQILRRTAGTKIYNAGNSLKMTADILGHESLDSTVFYAKTDMAGLRHVAHPWPCVPGKAGGNDGE